MNLVTGATGILGSHVVLQLLQDGREVVACRQKNSDLNRVEKLFSYYKPDHKSLFNKIKWIEVDIQDVFSIEEALEGIQNVFHCAGFVSFNSKDRKKLFDVNEKGTRNIVNACLTKKTEALCHVSSIATINNLDYVQILSEKVFWKTSGRESDYAISKYNAEREVWRGIEEGLNAIIVNPGVIIGPGFGNQSSSRIFEAGFKGGHKFYTEGRVGYVSVTDVAKIMCYLVEKRMYNNRFIVIENSYSFRQIFTMINEGFGLRAPAIKLNRSILNAGRYFESLANILTGRQKILSRSLINSAFNKQIYSNEKVKDALDFSFSPVPEMIAFTCKIYREENKKHASSI